MASATELEPAFGCDFPNTGVFAETSVACSVDMPRSAAECHKLLNSLAEAPAPTRAQRLALAFGRSWAADHAGPDEALRAERLARDELRALVRENPNDAMVLRALAAFEDNSNRRVILLRRVVDLDPGCGKAVHSLLLALPSDTPPERAERLRYMMTGYRHGSSWKLHFAALVYLHYLAQGEAGAARAFRKEVVDDMRLGYLQLDAENRTQSLELICHGDSFLLRLEGFCMGAIRQLADRDAGVGRPLGEDVLQGVAAMAYAARSVGLMSPHGQVAHFGEDGIEYVILLRDLLDGESEARRSAAYHMAYAELAGPERKVEELRKAWGYDPANGAVGLQVADALQRDGRYDEAIQVYRTIIANDDGRACFEWGPTTCESVAGKRLSELERDLASERQ